ncbi:MAG: phosphoglycolate phosphatase [Rhodospirillales bacterium]|nr:phosphoglycolate phosphatase [Rhodospirillales bacterium]
MIKAIVFDLDGTLVDSAPDLQAAINRVLGWAGRDTLSIEAVKGMVGDGVQKLVERALDATGGIPDEQEVEKLSFWVSRFLDEYKGHDAELTKPYPGVPETLAKLREAGFAMAVCTNKPQAATMEILEAFDLSRFFNAALGGDVLEGIRKPDPKHLIATLDALRATPAEAVMIGDHLNDLACARAAGSPAVLCTYGYSRVPVTELGADAVIDAFDKLPDALAGLS